jgi:hypothetical protein
MRIRLLLITAVLTAFSLVVAGPASAATVTKSDVVSSLLTVRAFGDGWHKTDLSGGSGGGDVSGCESATYTSTGVKAKASRDFQYAKTPTFITENVTSFGTRKAARRDFAKGVRLFSACTDFTVDGKTFTIKRLTVSGYADQVAAFRILGSVATAVGDVPISMFIVVTRWGRQQVSVVTTVGGRATSADLTSLKRSTVKISKGATGKVATVLGR